MRTKLACFENAAFFDKYTVIYLDEPVSNDPMHDDIFLYAGMSERPFSPQGFGQHGEIRINKSDLRLLRNGNGGRKFQHLGKKIDFSALPEDCQKLVAEELG